MSDSKPSIYVFGWPSHVGGADTKLAHLIHLLHQHCHLTIVPNERRHFQNKHSTRFLSTHRASYATFDELLHL